MIGIHTCFIWQKYGELLAPSLILTAGAVIWRRVDLELVRPRHKVVGLLPDHC